MGIYELLVLNEAMRPLILNRAPLRPSRKKRWSSACAPCARTVGTKCRAGQTTIEEVLRVTQIEEHLDALVEDTRG